MKKILLIALAVLSLAAVSVPVFSGAEECAKRKKAVPTKEEPGKKQKPSERRKAIAKKLYGKIKIVDYGEDFKVKRVDYGEDLGVKLCDFGADSPGEWKLVDFGEDYAVKFVTFGEDIEVKFVTSGEGPR